MDLLVIAGILAAFIAIAWLLETYRDSRKYRELKPRLDAVDAAERQLLIATEKWHQQVEQDRHAIGQLAKEKSTGFPWLASAYADYFSLQDLAEAGRLERKSHPARKSAETVREIAAKRRDAEKLWRVLNYQLKYYEALFPWLEEFRQEDLDDLIISMATRMDGGSSEAEPVEPEEDPARHWLTEAEYRTLSNAEKFQLALDRYWSRKKSSWEIGRDYERFIGYSYEAAGGAVQYHGIIEGVADLGRDLMVSLPNGQIEIAQCKYWSQHKQIHEKHIFQLYGTMVAYRLDNPHLSVRGAFYTSTSLSDRAKAFADTLGIAYREQHPLTDYPSIKCNVSDRGNIYHLPFDQQYDRTLIKERNECFVTTVAEAERRGFRRAFRWRGNASAGAA